jgi:biopolymer transport protein ExbD
MISKTRCTIVAMLITAGPLFGAVEFCGLMSGSGSTRFVIADATSGRRSEWIEVGQTFEDYTIVGFDGKEEFLSVRRGTETIRLPLKTAKATEGGASESQRLIMILIDGCGSISVRNDPDGIEALKAELRRVAAIVPQPPVRIHAGSQTEFERVRSVLELLRECGITKFSIATEL